MNTSYKNKYLKYKQKYLKLKNQIGGSSNPNQAKLNYKNNDYNCNKNENRELTWRRFPKFTGEMSNNNIINVQSTESKYHEIIKKHDIYQCQKDNQKKRELADMKERQKEKRRSDLRKGIRDFEQKYENIDWHNYSNKFFMNSFAIASLFMKMAFSLKDF